MTQSNPRQVTFDEFIAWYPAGSGKRYELHQGVIVEKPPPTGNHSQVAGFISGKLFAEIERSQRRDFIPKTCVVKAVDEESAYEPDVIVLNDEVIGDEPRWEQDSVVTRGASIRLIVEVVDDDWQEVCATKLLAYAKLGVPECWVVGSNPEQQAINAYVLSEGKYRLRSTQI